MKRSWTKYLISFWGSLRVKPSRKCPQSFWGFLLLSVFYAVCINSTCEYGHALPEILYNRRNHWVTAFMPKSWWRFSGCPKQRHPNSFLFCSWLKCLFQASPSCNFRGSDTNRNVCHWLGKFIFGAANLYLAEDGDGMIATEIAARISQLINVLTAVRLPWKWVALPADTVSDGNWLMVVRSWFQVYELDGLRWGQVCKCTQLWKENFLIVVDGEIGFRIILGHRTESCSSSLQI